MYIKSQKWWNSYDGQQAHKGPVKLNHSGKGGILSQKKGCHYQYSHEIAKRFREPRPVVINRQPNKKRSHLWKRSRYDICPMTFTSIWNHEFIGGDSEWFRRGERENGLTHDHAFVIAAVNFVNVISSLVVIVIFISLRWWPLLRE